MHRTRRQPTARSLPAAHAAARLAANDGGGPSAALAVAAHWCAAAVAERLPLPPLGAINAALATAKANPSRGSFDALSRALVRWCAEASGRGNAVDLAVAMLGAVNAAAALDAVQVFDAG